MAASRMGTEPPVYRYRVPFFHMGTRYFTGTVPANTAASSSICLSRIIRVAASTAVPPNSSQKMLSLGWSVVIGRLRSGRYTFTVGYTFTSTAPWKQLNSFRKRTDLVALSCRFSSAMIKSTPKLEANWRTSSWLNVLSRASLSFARKAESQMTTSSK